MDWLGYTGQPAVYLGISKFQIEALATERLQNLNTDDKLVWIEYNVNEHWNIMSTRVII